MEKERTEAEGNSLVDLETARLVLTPVTEEHIDPICAHFTKEVVTYMVPGPAKERGDMEAVVRRFMEQRRAGTDFVYAITLKGSSEFIGVASLHHVPAPVPELGIWTKDGGARASLWKGSHWGDASAGRFHGDRPAVLSCRPAECAESKNPAVLRREADRRRSVWCVRRTAGRSKRNDTKSKPEAGPASCVEQRRAAGLFYGKCETFIPFFRVKKIPAIAPNKNNRCQPHK